MQSIFIFYIITFVLSYIGYCLFVAIANNTLYGSKLQIFLLRQKSLGLGLVFIYLLMYTSQ